MRCIMLVMGKKVKIVRIVDVTELGRAGGHARAANLSPTELSDAGRKAVAARWDAYYRDHPEKLNAKLEREAKARKRKTKKAPG